MSSKHEILGLGVEQLGLRWKDLQQAWLKNAFGGLVQDDLRRSDEIFLLFLSYRSFNSISELLHFKIRELNLLSIHQSNLHWQKYLLLCYIIKYLFTILDHLCLFLKYVEMLI